MITCNFEDGHPAELRHAVVDVVVGRNDEILLEKRAKKLVEGGKWALAGGYMDRDETVTDTVHREVMEETGYEITDLVFAEVISNPKRKGEDRQNVAMVFFAQATTKTGESDWESDEVKWFKLDNLPPDSEIAFDHLETIELYKTYRAKPFPLPLVK